MRMRNKRCGKLELNVLRVNMALFHRDRENREYIAFCNYRWNRGIVKKQNDCLAAGCKYLRKLYTDVR